MAEEKAPNAVVKENTGPVVPQEQVADSQTGRGEYGGVAGHESAAKGLDKARESAAKDAKA